MKLFDIITPEIKPLETLPLHLSNEPSINNLKKKKIIIIIIINKQTPHKVLSNPLSAFLHN